VLVLHHRFAGFTATVWPTAAPVGPTGQPYNSTTTFYVVANMGVILFMFLLGCELDQTLLARQWRRSAPIALSAIMFPFGVGAAASVWLEVRGLQQGDACLVAHRCVCYIVKERS
jgi:Kef-type K+ transport system membrane component KefB